MPRGREPRVLLVVLGTDEEALEYHERYVRALGPLLWPWEVVLKGDR